MSDDYVQKITGYVYSEVEKRIRAYLELPGHERERRLAERGEALLKENDDLRAKLARLQVNEATASKANELYAEALRSNVYYNHTSEPIFINAGVIGDPQGGPGRGKMTYGVAPGQGIDLSILGLRREKP